MTDTQSDTGIVDEKAAFDFAVNEFIKEQLTIDLPWSMHLRNFLNRYESARQQPQETRQAAELPIEAMAKAALDKHCQLLTDIFMHLPTEVIDDDRQRVAAGFIGAIVKTCVEAARDALAAIEKQPQVSVVLGEKGDTEELIANLRAADSVAAQDSRSLSSDGVRLPSGVHTHHSVPMESEKGGMG